MGVSLSGGIPVILRTNFPFGIEAIRREYGDPRPFMRDSRISQEWPNQILTKVQLPAPLPLAWQMDRMVRSISCHISVASSLGSVLAEIHDAGLWPEVRSYGGCYAWRTQRGAMKLSTHSWAIAVDLDCADGRNRRGSEPVMHPAIVEAFDVAGWTWGGRFDIKDGMHWQACGGY